MTLYSISPSERNLLVKTFCIEEGYAVQDGQFAAPHPNGDMPPVFWVQSDGRKRLSKVPALTRDSLLCVPRADLVCWSDI